MSERNTSNGLPRVNVGTVPDSDANVRAQESRDLADRLGLTVDIEREFARGASVGEVAAALEPKLSAIDAGDRSAFLVGVRGTLGIPANFGMTGETEFAQWKAAREARMREAEVPAAESRDATPQQPAIAQQPQPTATPSPAGDIEQAAAVPAGEGAGDQGQSHAGHVNAIVAGIDPELIDGGEQVAQAPGNTPDEAGAQGKQGPGQERADDEVAPVAGSEGEQAARARAGKKARAILGKSGYEIPRSVQAQYVVRDGAFVDRKTEAIAFEDSGRKLSTKAEDRTTIEAMIAVAEAKNWGTLYVTGAQEFRRQAWIAAQVAGLEVAGYEPTAQDKAAVDARREEMRIGAGERPKEQQPENPVSPNDDKEKRAEPEAPGEKPARARLPERQQLAVDTLGAMLSQRGLQPEEVAKAIDAATSRLVEDRVHVGEVIEHGAARDEHNPENSRSYFVTLATANGPETVWGGDLQRSAEEGKFVEGKEVWLAYQGRTDVVVPTRERDSAGNLTGRTVDTLTHRHTWDVTTIDRLQELATEKVADREPAAKPDAAHEAPRQPEAAARGPEPTPAELAELRAEMDEWRKERALEQAREVIERHSTPGKRAEAARDLLRALGRDPNEFFDESGKPREEGPAPAAAAIDPQSREKQQREESVKEAAMRMVLEHEMNNAGIPEARRQEMRDELTATIAHAHENGIELEIPEPLVMDRSISVDQGIQAGVAHHQQQAHTPSLDVDR